MPFSLGIEKMEFLYPQNAFPIKINSHSFHFDLSLSYVCVCVCVCVFSIPLLSRKLQQEKKVD